MPTHYIPTKLVAVIRAAKERSREGTGEKYTARPAFIVPEGSKLIDVAYNWATEGFEREFFDNIPQTHLRVMGCEHRGEGGMAYKVVTDRGHLVDLREDEFLEAFFQGRIDPRGYIQGEYVWSVGGTQMRLVLVGSDLYNERLKAGQAEVAKTQYISGKDLVVGHKYRTPMGGNEALWYAGRIRQDGKLKYAWWSVREWKHFAATYSRKTLTVTSNTIAIEDLGEEEMPKAVFNCAIDGYGVELPSRTSLIWPDGTPQPL